MSTARKLDTINPSAQTDDLKESNSLLDAKTTSRLDSKLQSMLELAPSLQKIHKESPKQKLHKESPKQKLHKESPKQKLHKESPNQKLHKESPNNKI